jgi:hypothetical protein
VKRFILATLALAGCQKQAPAELVRVGAPCFNIEIPSNTRAEIIAPTFTRPEDGVPAAEAPGPIDIAIAAGDTPLMLYLFNGQDWRLTGAANRIVAIMTDSEAEQIHGAPAGAHILTHDNVRGERRRIHRYSTRDSAAERCLRWIAHFSSDANLLVADARIFALTGRHISNFQDPRDVLAFTAGWPDWRIRLDRHFAHDELPSTHQYALKGIRRRGELRTPPTGDDIDCISPRAPACQVLLRWLAEGSIRLATERDVDRWEQAFRRHHPLGHLWTPRLEEQNTAFVVLREITVPSGLNGAHAVTFFVEPGVPLPRGADRHGHTYSIAAGSIHGGFYDIDRN